MQQPISRVLSGTRAALTRTSIPIARPSTQRLQCVFYSTRPDPTRKLLNPTRALRITPGSERMPARPPQPPPTKTPEEIAELLPYIVRRTPSIQLPIYRKWMSGGTRQIILIKKADGDRRRMMQDLGEALSVDKDDIRIHPTTQHIEIKGNYFEPAKNWLLQQGF